MRTALYCLLAYQWVHKGEAWCSPSDKGDCFIMIRAGGDAHSAARGIQFVHTKPESKEEVSFGHIAGIPNGGEEDAELHFALGSDVHAKLDGKGVLSAKRVRVGEELASQGRDEESPFILEINDGGLQIKSISKPSKIQFASSEDLSKSTLEHDRVEKLFKIMSTESIVVRSSSKESSEGSVEIQGAVFHSLAGELLPTVQVGTIDVRGEVLVQAWPSAIEDGKVNPAKLTLGETDGQTWSLQNGGTKIGFGLFHGNTKVIRVATGSPKDSLSISSDGNVGVGTPWPSVKLDVNGGVQGTSAYSSASDRRWKTNVEDLARSLPEGSVLPMINKVRPVRFDWDHESYPHMNFEHSSQIGFIAQELEEIFPELVTTNLQGMKSVKYGGLSPLLVAGIKELELQQKALLKKVQELEAQIRNVGFLSSKEE